jgi:hypothetical protein
MVTMADQASRATRERTGKIAMAPPARCRNNHLIALLFTAVSFAGCSDSTTPISDPPPDPALGPEPVLWNLGVDFDAAFTLDDVDTILYRFLEFGFEVRDTHGELKPLPHFTYVLDRSIEVISPMEGIVDAIHVQDESIQDYAIWLKPHGGPTLWLVEFDHVTQVAVEEGDEVQVGDPLGYPGGSGTFGAVELMVNGPSAHVCPFQVFAPEVAEETRTRIVEFMAAWDAAKWALPESHSHHPDHPSGWYTPYSEVEMVVPGCRSWDITFLR